MPTGTMEPLCRQLTDERETKQQLIQNYADLSYEQSLTLVGLNRTWAVFRQDIVDRDGPAGTTLTAVDVVSGRSIKAATFGAISNTMLGMLSAGHSDVLMRDLGVAVESTARQPLAGMDHLCCGNGGQVAFLFDAARLRGNDDWEQFAWRRLDQLFAARGGDDEYHHLPCGDAQHLFQPTFMQGGAGIGYAWLRIARPELALPSPLMME